MIAVYLFAAIGLAFVAGRFYHNAGDIWYLAVWYVYVIPQAKFMMWRLKKAGWRMRQCVKFDGSTYVDPDTWVHPDIPMQDHERELRTFQTKLKESGAKIGTPADDLAGYSLHAAYQLLKSKR